MNRKKLGIAFGIGILLCGLGCGIAFAQYSGFDYAGEKRIGDENLKTETVEKDIDSDGTIEIMYPGYRCDVSVVADENVPIDKINFDVTYNTEVISLYISKFYTTCTDDQFDEDGALIEEENEVEQKEINFGFGRYKNDSDIDTMFKVKDELLKDIKNKQIGDYYVTAFDSIVVRVNPANYDRVRV
ncbi:MAG: hypothetical protein EGQ35_06775 [Clostridiales bacterium]|nr:hypothetical protein [Clostridiales bacterium]